MNLAILIPVFNNLDYTKSCLKRINSCLLEANHSIQINTIVIDDGSTDGTNEWLKENEKTITILNGDGNLWWSGGINMGATYAVETLKADYILWWNNDIEPKNDYFKNLFSHLENNPLMNIIGSKIYIKNTDKLWGYGGYFNPKNGKKGLYGNWEDDKPEFLTPKLVDWLPGMGSVFPAGVFKTIGYLDQKNFPQYHGDSDYTIRAKVSGYSITVFPDLILYNDTTNSGLRHNDTFKVLKKSLTSVKSNYNFKKEFLFYKKHGKSLYVYVGFLSKYLFYIGGFFKWKLLGLFGVKRKSRQL